MPTNADHQRAYRQRHLKEGDLARINQVVHVHAKAALKRLANHYGVSQREALERVLAEREAAVVAALNPRAERFYYADD